MKSALNVSALPIYFPNNSLEFRLTRFVQKENYDTRNNKVNSPSEGLFSSYIFNGQHLLLVVLWESDKIKGMMQLTGHGEDLHFLFHRDGGETCRPNQEQQHGEVTKSFHKPQPSTVPNHKKDPPKNPSETYWHWLFPQTDSARGT